MLQNPCKTLGLKKNIVCKIPPLGELHHIQPVAYHFLVQPIETFRFFYGLKICVSFSLEIIVKLFSLFL